MYIDDKLAREDIRLLILLAGIPVMFISKKSRKLKLNINYHKLNAIMVKNRYLLPLVCELRDILHGIK